MSVKPVLVVIYIQSLDRSLDHTMQALLGCDSFEFLVRTAIIYIAWLPTLCSSQATAEAHHYPNFWTTRI